MSEIVVDPIRALKLAESFKPIIYQGWHGIKDFITPLMFDSPERLFLDIPNFLSPPTIYFLIREDLTYIYAYYLVFHPFDWSMNRNPIIKKLDSHLYDTEGLCFRHNKITGKLDVATVFHFRIKFAGDVKDRRVFIEPEGHGILPFREGYLTRCPNYILYSQYRLVDLQIVGDKQWERMKKIIAPAKIPQEQYDNLWYKNQTGLPHRKGDMFLRPEMLFLKAELRNKV